PREMHRKPRATSRTLSPNRSRHKLPRSLQQGTQSLPRKGSRTRPPLRAKIIVWVATRNAFFVVGPSSCVVAYPEGRHSERSGWTFLSLVPLLRDVQPRSRRISLRCNSRGSGHKRRAFEFSVLLEALWRKEN